MRFSFWTSVGALAVLSVASCTPGENKTVAAPSPAVASPAQAPVAATAPSPPEVAAEAEEGDEILMVWAEAEPDEGAPPLEVQLKADVSGGVGDRKIKWEFGDGSPASSEMNPKHRYEKAGTFRASVEVSDASGDSDSDYVDIEIAAE
ncbi:MAG: PKD domain-containing protein [Deltaproteobacteria bacterium]|nr:PKD domain-containing protein [Deltaproteobacteria bacterium]